MSRSLSELDVSDELVDGRPELERELADLGAMSSREMFSESHKRSLRNPQIPPSNAAREHLYLARRGCADREESFTMHLDSFGRSRLFGMASLPRRLCGDRVDFPPLHFVTLIIFRAASREILF